MTDINFIRSISNLNKNNLSTPVIRNKEFDVNSTFKDILNEKSKKVEVSFSKHANERIEERNIGIDENVTNRLNEAVCQAKDKGLKNVLVMIDNSAFIVSTVNNKVITAVNSNELKENVFTNIDGAVIK
ncbi:flagellar operon protein [Sedimentibacter acidaminivorans]|jgi:flagellar operon protein|uniref:Flagellar operon protein n=1 Tax=Sedimentibacter acidaminivorans TaxID=913099 RepID=A0ABS4GDH2_9FIRM|nr:TIGR02530 family flagellar biosynthesis protein [Sedimentibacter acidaminivorans]MBP1925748.1 flagellar operon protein [Sedimentibacter acidaminivorans]